MYTLAFLRLTRKSARTPLVLNAAAIVHFEQDDPGDPGAGTRIRADGHDFPVAESPAMVEGLIAAALAHPGTVAEAQPVPPAQPVP